MAMKVAVGIDVGRKAVKVVADTGHVRAQLMFPAVAMPAMALSDDAARAMAEPETVRVGQREWFVGRTAEVQGSGLPIESGLHHDWISTEQHAALVLSSIEQMQLPEQLGRRLDPDDLIVAVGLPAELYAAQRAGYLEIIKKLLPGSSVIVMPQPMGPYVQLMYAADGSPSRTHHMRAETWGAIVVGHYTSDLLIVHRNVVQEASLKSTSGAVVAIEKLRKDLDKQGLKVDALEGAEIMRTRTLMNWGRPMAVGEQVDAAGAYLAEVVTEKARSVFGERVRTMNGVLLAGGGAGFVEAALARHWGHVRVADNPRLAVAEGFCRAAVATRAAMAKAPSALAAAASSAGTATAASVGA